MRLPRSLLTLPVALLLIGHFPENAQAHGGQFNQWTPMPPVEPDARPPRPLDPTLSYPPPNTAPPSAPPGTPRPISGPPPQPTSPPPGTPGPIATPPPQPVAPLPTLPPKPNTGVMTPPAPAIPTKGPQKPQVTPIAPPAPPTNPTTPPQPEVTPGNPTTPQGRTTTKIPVGAGQPHNPAPLAPVSDPDVYWDAWWFSGNQAEFQPMGVQPEPVKTENSSVTKIVGADASILEALERALRHEYWMIRRTAAMRLGEVGTQADADKLLPLLQDDSPSVQAAAYMALGQLQDAAQVERIIACVENTAERRFVRGYAAVGLGFLGRFAREKGLATTLERVLAALKARLRDPEESLEVHVGALTAAELCRAEELLPEIQELTGHKSEDVSCGAITALGKIGASSSLPFLITLLDGGKLGISRRQSAYMALGGLIERADEALVQRIVPLLTRRLTDKQAPDREKDVFAANQIIIALARLGRGNPKLQLPITQQVLFGVLQNGGIEARGFAAIGLGICLSGPKANEKLVVQAAKLLRNMLQMTEKDATVKGALCQALGLLKDQDARPLLRALATDRNEQFDLRKHAFFALGFLGNPEDVSVFEAILNDPRQNKRSEVVWYASIGLGLLYQDRDLPPVFEEQFLVSHNAELRGAVSVALGATRNERAIAMLCERAKVEEHDYVLAKLLGALGEIGSKYGASSWSLTARSHNFKVNGSELSDLY